MLKIAVIDHSAESRNRILEKLNQFLQSDSLELEIVPRINLQPYSIEEIRFKSAPEIIILGDELLVKDPTKLSNIRKLLPDTPIIIKINKQLESLASVEQFARMGADDTISDSTTAGEFLRKVILLARRADKTKSGKLIVVDGGKGGVGVTTIAAGLAEALVAQNKKVALLDFDFETQDLSRFLQTRPFINENLQMLLDRTRPVTQEFVEQCLVKVWSDVDTFYCMPPVAESEDLYDMRALYGRTLISILEILDASFDYIVVDVGAARGGILKALYRVADKVLFVVNNDPASLYASVDKILKMRGLITPTAQLKVIENTLLSSGLPNKFMRAEFLRAAKLDINDWCSKGINYSKNGQKWPASGSSIYGQGGNAIVSALSSALFDLELIEEPQKERLFSQTNAFHQILQKLCKRLFTPKSNNIEAASKIDEPLPLPEPRLLLSVANISEGGQSQYEAASAVEFLSKASFN